MDCVAAKQLKADYEEGARQLRQARRWLPHWEAEAAKEKNTRKRQSECDQKVKDYKQAVETLPAILASLQRKAVEAGW